MVISARAAARKAPDAGESAISPARAFIVSFDRAPRNLDWRVDEDFVEILARAGMFDQSRSLR